MIKVEVTGPEEHRWKIHTKVPTGYGDPQKVQRLKADGQELQIIKRDIKGVPVATIQCANPAEEQQTWYGDDAKYIWHHFITYYRGI